MFDYLKEKRRQKKKAKVAKKAAKVDVKVAAKVARRNKKLDEAREKSKRKKAEDKARYCVCCLFFNPAKFSSHEIEYARCSCPKQGGMLLVSPDLSGGYCDLLRQIEDDCGKKGKWFQLKEEK